jgi:hypothetical protein
MRDIQGKRERSFTQKFNVLKSILVSRAKLASGIGKTHNDDRDIYTECGYPVNITYDDYVDRYHRQDIAKRIVDMLPDSTWGFPPVVYENEEDELTEFELKWNQLVDRHRVFHYLWRLDRVSG